MSFGSKKFIINFFREDVLRKFVNSDSAEHANSRNLLISIDAENEAEVDAMLYKAEKAGGIIYAKGGYNQGWMYGGGFLDLDGHQWNLLYMDMSKATSKP